jgi:hypothetical protein
MLKYSIKHNLFNNTVSKRHYIAWNDKVTDVLKYIWEEPIIA